MKSVLILVVILIVSSMCVRLACEPTERLLAEAILTIESRASILSQLIFAQCLESLSPNRPIG